MGTHDLPDLVTRAAGSRPDHVALVEPEGAALTWAELENEVDRVAGGLVSAGVVAGTRVLLALGNRIELVTAYLAVLRAQAVAVPVAPGASETDLARLLSDSESRYAVGEARSLPRLRAAGADPGIHLVAVEDAGPGESAYAELASAGPLPPLLEPERLAALLYTSGVSAPPRAAMLSHRALAANVDQVGALEPTLIGPDDVVLGVLPLFHVYGLAAVLGGVLREAATLVLVDGFDPERVLDVVAEHGCSVLPVAPRALELWLEVPDLAGRLAGVRSVHSGSAQVDRETCEAFVAAAGVVLEQGYGLTEAAPVVTSTVVPGPDGAPAAAGTLGRAIPGVELRVLDTHDDPVVPGDPGEIWIRGSNLFSGYWPDAADGPDGDGWWATGDLGVLDGEGSLSLVDRVRETVVVEGFPVYPQEVEDELRQVSGVAEAAVIGDQDREEALVAYVVADEGTDPATLRIAVLEHAERHLATFKRPRRVEVVERLPLTATGLVQKGRLRHLERRRALGLLA
jgi:long-chain acyl-CoA synthetase